MPKTPVIVGKGRAGVAMAKSLAILSALHPELDIGPVVWHKRGASLAEERAKYQQAFLVVTNPHGLHAETILEGAKAGFDGVICEKPACVTQEQSLQLRTIEVPTAILHVYRQTWGVQSLRKLVAEGHLGEIIAIEGKYWQSSTAARAVSTSGTSAATWKDDPGLSGPSDVLLDLATHWADAATFIANKELGRVWGWKTNVNSPTQHRDSHVQLALSFENGPRGWASISKTVHGATNQFEIQVLGTKRSASWEFLNPDEIVIGEGRDRRVVTRTDEEWGSRQAAFHGMGWVEGYIEIARQLLSHVYFKKPPAYPALKDNLKMLERIFLAEWD